MKIKLLYLPRHPTSVNDAKNETLSGVPFLPPLGIATLTSFLKKHGIHVGQDDLMIKVFHHNYTHGPAEQINLRIFNDENRIKNFLKKGFDPFLEEEGEKILKFTQTKGFDIFGFSIYDTYNPSAASIAMVLGKILKEKYDATILIGGSIYEEVTRKLLETKFVDYRIKDEIGLLDFCEMFKRGCIKFEKIRGICYLNNSGDVTFCDSRNDAEIVTRHIIEPCFDGLPLELYKPKISFNIDGKNYRYDILVLPYLFIRGCPNRCAFCSLGVSPYYGVKKPEEVAHDLKRLSKKYKTKYFFFINTSINPKYVYTEKLIDELQKYDVSILWSDCANFSEMDSKLLEGLKEVGAVKLLFGIESASPSVLKYIEKPFFTIEHAEKILKKVYELGIWGELDLICGFPYETERDVNLTIEFIRKNIEYIRDFSFFKFWLDGKIKKYPERYAIHIRAERESGVSRAGARTVFDEMSGLVWEDKVKQIDYFHNKLQKLHHELELVSQKHIACNITEEELSFIHFMKWWNNPNKKWDKKGKFFIGE